MATTGYRAGLEGGDTNISFEAESVWADQPSDTSGTYTTVRAQSWSDGRERGEVEVQELRNDGVTGEVVTVSKNTQPNLVCPFVPVTTSPLIASAVNGEFSLGTLVNGIIFNSFKFLRQVAANQTRVFAGTVPSGFTISLQLGQPATITFPMIARDRVLVATAPTGTVLPPDTQNVFSPINSLSGFLFDGNQIGDAQVGLELTVTKAGQEAIPDFTSPAAQGMTRGSINVTGTVTAYLNDATLLEQSEAETKGPMVFSLTNGSVGYNFTLPVVKLGEISDDVADSGPIEATIPFSCEADGSGIKIQIDEVS